MTLTQKEIDTLEFQNRLVEFQNRPVELQNESRQLLLVPSKRVKATRLRIQE